MNTKQTIEQERDAMMNELAQTIQNPESRGCTLEIRQKIKEMINEMGDFDDEIKDDKDKRWLALESEQIESQEKKVRQMRMLPLKVSRSPKQSAEKKLEGFDPLFRAWIFSRIQNKSMRI